MNTLISRRFGKTTMAELLQQAINEERAHAAARFSSHLDALIRHIADAELSRVEIIELLSQESVKFHNIGLSREEAL
ncbi:TPA: DUF2732 family protein [Salmonella enterica subsp. enterica serovar Javiana]|nr:DUF2732 family protein [Salmonella enterica]EDX2886524.1 DUF2732 family protein [Salmonella enterica subsp. enterica serovar Thompson]HEC8236945.1 DUF2732 family protein [Salmonella enterica subsp. enterica serovar Javiana]EBO9747396.1 DUF2732 family protein [Salmonella enterica]EIC3123588.1 DUF2732 family protein [Salmonella enterica]